MTNYIYTNKQILDSEIYGNLMQSINKLYIESGEPEMLDDSGQTTTTGNSLAPYWSADRLGDWEGEEENVASAANKDLDDVYTGLGIMGNGGIFYYYRTDEWDNFVDDAVELIDAFNHDGAYEKLQSEFNSSHPTSVPDSGVMAL